MAYIGHKKIGKRNRNCQGAREGKRRYHAERPILEVVADTDFCCSVLAPELVSVNLIPTTSPLIIAQEAKHHILNHGKLTYISPSRK